VDIDTRQQQWSFFPYWRGSRRRPELQASTDIYWGGPARPALISGLEWGRYAFEVPARDLTLNPTLVLDAFRGKTVDFLVKP
jgi:hypothetical protein